jgi:hypothetical protein
MIDSGKTALQNIFKQQKTITVDAGCEIEYNMNSLIDGITVSSATPDSSYTSQIAGWPSGKANPYKKLFPIDSIIKPFRPLDSGIKYFVFLPNDTTLNTFSPYRSLQYPSSQPRIYYPGVTTQYKYWLGAKDTNINLTLTYKQTSSSYLGNKHALANKIIIRFEKYHALPLSYTVTVTRSDGSIQTLGPIAPPSSGNIELNYTGSAWTQHALTEPVSYATPVSIKSINLVATSPGGGEVIGVIELSARWVKDISSDVVSFDIQKESSSSSEDILPVGSVTANSITANIVKYNQSVLQTVSYNRESTSIDPSLIYLVKNAEIRPFFKVYHSGGTTVAGSYDKVKQGTFYINDFNIDAYGETVINALDGSKYLMETLCPDIVCEFYPVTAILRRLLDSIGFSNYNFNLNATSETSIPQINYWWTDDTTTVWQAIQDLCRDIQMNAFFDENNVLQFYSRDYIYDKTRSSVWDFYNEAEGSSLPNIIDFNQKEIVAANYVKVLWQSALTSNYTGTSGELWTSPTTFLSAGGLQQSITESQMELLIDTKTIDIYSKQQVFYNFSGFVLIDSEIIEYEAIGYDITLQNGTKEHQWIYSESDVNKYRALSKPGYEDVTNPANTSYFKPSGRYKVKKRGALGTVAAAHSAGNSNLGNWTGREVTWDNKASTTYGTSTTPSSLDFYYNVKPKQISLTSVELDFVAPATTPTSYIVEVQRLNDDGSNAGAAITLPAFTGEPPLLIENLFPGSKYRFKVTPKNGSVSGNSIISATFTLSAVSYNGNFSSNPVLATALTPGKSYLTLTNSTTAKDKYVMAYRDFAGMNLTSSTPNTSYPPYSYTANTYSEAYYAFGTSVFLDSNISSQASSAGMGFFVDDLGKTGYFIVVETTKSATAKETKSARILKADGTGVRILADSQRTATSTFEGVYGGKQYNLDVRVKVLGNTIDIIAYVNGFKIQATDSNSMLNAKETNKILDQTKTVAVICGNGTVAFDYVYATDMNKTKYEQSLVDPNMYLAQFSNDLLDMSFGDLIYDAKNSENTLKSQTVDDFGTVVREIYYVKTKLNTRPAYPLLWSTAGNKSVNIIGQSVSNFNAEAYVLNNTSTTVPLSNGAEAGFFIYGNSISSSGTLEYSTDDSAEYANKEPVIFESRWLQNEYDVKQLANFIKTKAINKGKLVDMEVFGNPLLSVGDIVKVKYTYQGLLGTEAMIITDINQAFEEGINTSITCRTL